MVKWHHKVPYYHTDRIHASTGKMHIVKMCCLVATLQCNVNLQKRAKRAANDDDNAHIKSPKSRQFTKKSSNQSIVT